MTPSSTTMMSKAVFDGSESDNEDDVDSDGDGRSAGDIVGIFDNRDIVASQLLLVKLHPRPKGHPEFVELLVAHPPPMPTVIKQALPLLLMHVLPGGQ